MGIANTLYKRRFTESKTIAQDLLVETTWADLFMKTQNKELIPGQLYRITDFTTIIKDNYTIAYGGTNPISVTSAGKRFDVVVLALTNDTLSEEASVLPNKTNNPFTGCKLEAWSLKYSFFNDANRFAWAAAPQYNSNATVLVDGVNTIADDVATVVFTANSDVHTLHVLRTNTTDRDAYSVIATADGDYYTLQGVNEVEEYYTKVPYPKAGDVVYTQSQGSMRPFYTIKTISWALSPQGKGVIYRMIDEWNNDVCYDFKNIRFSGNIQYGDGISAYVVLANNYTFGYTNGAIYSDGSLVGNAHNNIVEVLTENSVNSLAVIVNTDGGCKNSTIKVCEQSYFVADVIDNCIINNVYNVYSNELLNTTLDNCYNVRTPSGFCKNSTLTNIGSKEVLYSGRLGIPGFDGCIMQNILNLYFYAEFAGTVYKGLIVQNLNCPFCKIDQLSLTLQSIGADKNPTTTIYGRDNSTIVLTVDSTSETWKALGTASQNSSVVWTNYKNSWTPSSAPFPQDPII